MVARLITDEKVVYLIHAEFKPLPIHLNFPFFLFS